MKFWRALAAVAMLTMMEGGIAMAQVVLAKDGKSLYRIVVPRKGYPFRALCSRGIATLLGTNQRCQIANRDGQ
jgi:hypothetical protein